MLVVFDTNVWLKEFGLNTALGAAARFFLLHKAARIALPEVVRLEVEQNLRKNLNDYVVEIERSHRQLLNVFGTLKEIVLPDQAAIEDRIGEVFSDLGVEVIAIPFSLDSAKASFLKTIYKQPPSDKNQQFKDGVLWADCVALLQEDDVVLVSEDKAFYENREYVKGLARNLRAEIKGTPHTLTICPELESLLEEIRSDIAVDQGALTASFLAEFDQSINSMLSRNRFSLGACLSVQKTLYATEDPNRLSIEFTIDYQAEDAGDQGRTDGRLRLRGDGTYEVSTNRFTSLRNYGEHLTWKASDGTEEQARNQVAFVGSLVLGHREVTHAVRYKLD